MFITCDFKSWPLEDPMPFLNRDDEQIIGKMTIRGLFSKRSFGTPLHLEIDQLLNSNLYRYRLLKVGSNRY